MVKITKRVVEAAEAQEKDYLIWDDELPGFGLRVFSSGKRSYVIQYRTKGRSRRYTIGLHGAWAPETARREAKVQLGRVAGGDDPVEDRQLDHKAITVKELCTRYLADLRAGLILGKGGRPKKPSTITTDTGRIERHIIPLIGTRRVKDLTKTDINKVLEDIMAGKTRVSVKTKKLRGKAVVKGGAGTATRTVGLLGGSLPTPSKQGLSRATRPMASANQRTTCESVGSRRRSIEYWVGCSATQPSKRNTLQAWTSSASLR